MEENIKWYKNKKIIITLVSCMLVILLVISILLIHDSKNNKPITKNKAETIKYDVNGSYMTENQINNMYLDIASYIGRKIKITGVVSEVQKQENGFVVRMYRDTKNYEQNTIVFVYDTNININVNDYIKIDGYIDQKYEYQNAMGVTIVAPLIVSYNTQISNYMDVVSPAIKSVDVNQTQNQNGCIFTINKVEFAENETRVYVSITNNTNWIFNFFKYNSKITQNGRQYEYQTIIGSGYQEVQLDILPGITSSGILTFPAINHSDFNIVLDGFSDNWKLDINPYQFNIKVQ